MGLDNPLHVALLVLLVLIVFGAKRLPEIGRSLGTGMHAFREAITASSTAPGTGSGRDAGSPAPSFLTAADGAAGVARATPGAAASNGPVGPAAEDAESNWEHRAEVLRSQQLDGARSRNDI
jgi:sec-independent protein translocase protein TatA